MYRVDANLDGYVSIIDAHLVMREYVRLFNDQEPRTYSDDVAERSHELSFDTVKLFYLLCRVEPVQAINGTRPTAGRRWFPAAPMKTAVVSTSW
ncbi:MAG: hypothetical protein R3B54_13910 [Bdellovibrionota bacterium]